MNEFEYNLYSNKNNNCLFQESPMFMIKITTNHLHHLQAVAQLLIDNLGPLGHRQVAAGGQEQVLHVLSVPIKVWGVEEIT